ncbi:hypothetical protein, partial [Streptomyces viridochromogenes]|uniref:hypothetical protein n=1 Tax=Streptomyces viridochromogenes TaxID=1938 RepID=UPI001F240624
MGRSPVATERHPGSRARGSEAERPGPSPGADWTEREPARGRGQAGLLGNAHAAPANPRDHGGAESGALTLAGLDGQGVLH